MSEMTDKQLDQLTHDLLRESRLAAARKKAKAQLAAAADQVAHDVMRVKQAEEQIKAAKDDIARAAEQVPSWHAKADKIEADAANHPPTWATLEAMRAALVSDAHKAINAMPAPLLICGEDCLYIAEGPLPSWCEQGQPTTIGTTDPEALKIWSRGMFPEWTLDDYIREYDKRVDELCELEAKHDELIAKVAELTATAEKLSK